MVDFHSHILPNVDDGSSSIDMSLEMLRESYRQGVHTVCATPHFYANETDPATFLRDRNRAYRALAEAAKVQGGNYPRLVPGAEVLYFPGMSAADELKQLCIGRTNCLLIEPPMFHWSQNMLDEIEETGKYLHCIPVVAHLDRYMRVMGEHDLIELLRGRKLLIQVNASFFVREDMKDIAMEYLRDDRIHFIGSDCHNLTSRPPNLIEAKQAIEEYGLAWEFEEFNGRINRFLRIQNV